MEINQRQLLLKKKTISLLPKEYQRVEYIESTGTQYINTNQKFTHPISFKVRAQKLVYSVVYVFGAVGTQTAYGGSVSFNQNSNGTNPYFSAIGRYNQYQGYATCYMGNWNDIELEGGSVTINGTTKTFTIGTRSSDSNIILFGLNNAGTVEPYPVQVANFQIFTGDTERIKVRDFIPCYRKSDGVAGMYDLCGSICPLTDTPFYINSGTGDFLRGNNV